MAASRQSSVGRLSRRTGSARPARGPMPGECAPQKPLVPIAQAGSSRSPYRLRHHFSRGASSARDQKTTWIAASALQTGSYHSAKWLRRCLPATKRAPSTSAQFLTPLKPCPKNPLHAILSHPVFSRASSRSRSRCTSIRPIGSTIQPRALVGMSDHRGSARTRTGTATPTFSRSRSAALRIRRLVT